MNKLTLPDGATYGYGADGQRICTGSSMGRRNSLPDDCNQPAKLRLVRLRWVGGDYDQWGAYWGRNGVNHVYCAFGWHVRETDRPEDAPNFMGETRVFVRAMNRKDAKAQVREKLPLARFYR